MRAAAAIQACDSHAAPGTATPVPGIRLSGVGSALEHRLAHAVPEAGGLGRPCAVVLVARAEVRHAALDEGMDLLGERLGAGANALAELVQHGVALESAVTDGGQ